MNLSTKKMSNTYSSIKKNAKFLFFTIALIVCFINYLQAQDQEVAILQKTGSISDYRCRVENTVYDESSFAKISADKDCSKLFAPFKPDLKTQTFIGFEAGGDCHVRANAKVFRNDSEKKYKVRIKKFGGGCRAAGIYQGWLIIEKIPFDYQVEFSETRVDNYQKNKTYESEYFDSFITKDSPEILEMQSVDLKGCLRQNQLVFTDQKSFVKAIRNDASRNWCLKNIEKIDFNKYSLLGIELRTDYCSIPHGLKYEVSKDKYQKNIFSTSFTTIREAQFAGASVIISFLF